MKSYQTLFIILSLLISFGSKAQKIERFHSSNCNGPHSFLDFNKKYRIVDLNVTNDRLMVKFNARANCTVKYQIGTKVKSDSLHLKLIPIPIDTIKLFDGSKEYHYEAATCHCWFTYTLVVKLSNQTINHFTLEGILLKQFFVAKFDINKRPDFCKGISSEFPSLNNPYKISKGDTINLIDRTGARQGIHRRSDKLLLLFKDDQLKEVWGLKDDRFIEYVIEYKKGKIISKRTFE